MKTDSLKTMRYGKSNGIATITFDRPKVMNAINNDFFLELIGLLEEIDTDASVRCVVLTGGEKCFVAGADINMFDGLAPAAGEAITTLGQKMTARLAGLDKPTIAAVSGLAFGGGCEIALACDFRIASSTARFGLPEVSLGLIPGAGGTQRLSAIVGAGRAKHLILTGEPVDAEAALRIGLVTAVVEAEKFQAYIDNMAEKLSKKPPLALRAAKRCIDFSSTASMTMGLGYERQIFTLVADTADAKEGTTAFIEKRPPAFCGR